MLERPDEGRPLPPFGSEIGGGALAPEPEVTEPEVPFSLLLLMETRSLGVGMLDVEKNEVVMVEPKELVVV